MTFALPAIHNTHNHHSTLGPPDNPRHNSTLNAPQSPGQKTAGALPITLNADDWERDPNSSTALSGYAFEFQASQASWDVSGATRVMLGSTQNNAPNRINYQARASNGVQMRLYSGTGSPPSNYRTYDIGGNDTAMGKSITGQFRIVMDLDAPLAFSESETGTFDNTAVTTYAFYKRPTTGMAGGSSCWSYEGRLYICETTKGATNIPRFTGTSDFDDAVTLVQGTSYTNKLGNWVRKVGDVVFMDMPFEIGNNSTETDFNDNGLTIVSPANANPVDPAVRITSRAMVTFLNLRNNAADTATFSGTWIWGSRAAFDWDQDDSAVVTFNSPTFRGMGEFTLGSSITGPATWDDVDPVVFADTGVDVDGSTFKNQNGNHALEMTAGAMDIANMRFESYASAHAILIDTAGTYNFSNVFFDQSGTNDIETTHATGTVTINISNGGTVPTVTETGAGSVVINNNVTIRITVNDTSGSPIQNARVRVTATETVGTITSGDVLLTGLTNASGIIEDTTFNYEAAFDPTGLDIAIRVRQGTNAPYKKTSETTGTITTAGYIATVALLPDE